MILTAEYNKCCKVEKKNIIGLQGDIRQDT